MREIPFNEVTWNQSDFDALSTSFYSGRWSGNGPRGKQAESLLSNMHLGAPALLTPSCTHALEMCALLLELKPGDEVIVPAFTFVSTALAFVLHGAKPVFVDVKPDTLNIDEELVEAAITSRTRAIVSVNYAGFGANYAALTELCEKYHLELIEDNAHGLGGALEGRTLGTFGSMSTLSFHETKNVTCGEGGAIVLNNAGMLERAEILREKGTDRSRFFRGQVDKYSWIDQGSSWVQSELLAGILVSQLSRVPEINSRRVEIWNQYHTGLLNLHHEDDFRLPVQNADYQHTGHLFHIRLAGEEMQSDFINYMKSNGISSVFHYQSLPGSKFISERNLADTGHFPVTDRASAGLVRLPLHLGLSDSDVERILENVQIWRKTLRT